MFTQTLEYHDQDTLLEGYLAYDDKQEGPRPAILISHDWSGRNEFANKKAEELAKLGYVGFSLDMYGKGKIGKNNDEKSTLMQPLVQNRALLRRRINAGLNALKQLSVVDQTCIGAIGFCFGGLCVLDLARSGADVKGVVSFHGFMHSDENLPNQTIKAKVLVLHGYDDPMAPPSQLNAFAKEMSQANVDWQVHFYGQTMHAFTNPVANDRKLGTVYNQIAAQRAWLAMKDFFVELFNKA